MNGLQKSGGIAALILAAAYITGLGLNFTLLDTSGIVDPLQKVTFLVEKQALMYSWILFIYIVFAVFLVVLALALHAELKSGAAVLAQTATAFGLIWAGLLLASGNIFETGLSRVVTLYSQDPAQAAAAWFALNTVHEGIAGANELPGGLWTLLISWAALQAGRFPRLLNYLGLLIGIAGLLSVIPALYTIGVAVFALGQIIWWIGLGISILRQRSPTERRLATAAG